MRVFTLVGIGLAMGGVVCLLAVAWLTKTSGETLGGASKIPILLLILGIALLYGSIRWLAFGGLLRRIASAGPTKQPQPPR